MEHSRLLKFFVSGRTSKMAENQAKVESEVPGAHNIRGDSSTPNQNDVETSKPKIISSFIEVHTEVNDGEKVVRRHQVIRNGDHEKEASVEDKNKTKIPISRLRQTVEKVKAKRQNSMEKAKKEFESQIPIRRTSVPKTTDAKRTTEDEFDKLYEEAVKADDTVAKALETKFEEIIHDYDENKLQPIDVEKVRRSKIPFLKRRSLQDADGTQERNSRIIAAREKVKLRKSLSTNDEKYETVSQVIVDSINKADNLIDIDGNNKGSIEIIQVKNEKITENSPVIYTNNETGEVKFKIDTKADNFNPITSELDDLSQKEDYLEPELSTNVHREFKITKTVSVEQDSMVNETKTTEIMTEFQIQENEIQNSIQIETPVIESEVEEHTETNETSYDEKDFIENKLNNITIETEKLSEDIKTFARTNSKEFETNLTTIDAGTTKNDISNESTNNLRIENDETPSLSKTEFNNNFIDSYLRSRSRNFDTKFDDNIKITTPKNENIEKSLEKEINLEKFGQKEEHIKSQFFDTPLKKNNTVNSFKNETINSNNIKHNKAEISDTLNTRDKAENDKKLSKKEMANKYNVKERDDEFVTTFRGKVGRLISRIDSIEPLELESPKEPPTELPKKKTVLSKIAMFERLESATPAKAKPKPKPLKLVTKDVQPEVKAHVHLHTPLIVNEIFKPFYDKHELNTNIEPLVESETETHLKENEAEITKLSEERQSSIENDILKDLINEPIPAEEIILNKSISSESQKPYNFETHKDMDTVEEVRIAYTPKDKTKHFKYEKPEPKTPINDAPVIIPKLRPVREILSQFEPKYKNIDDDEVFHKGTFRSKVKEALDELKQADIDVNHILQVKNDVYEELTEQNTHIKDETTDFNQEIAKVEDKEQKFDNKRDKKQDFTENFEIKSKKRNDYLIKTKVLDTRRTTSVADLYPGQTKGKVSNIIVRMKSYDIMELGKKEVQINIKEMPRKRSVSEKIALFERKLTPLNADTGTSTITTTTTNPARPNPTTPIHLTHLTTTTPIDPTHPSPTTPINPTDRSYTTHITPIHPSPTTTTDPSTTSPIDPTQPSHTTLIHLTNLSITTPGNPTEPSIFTTIDPIQPNTTPITLTDPSTPTPINTIHPIPTTTIEPIHLGTIAPFSHTDLSITTPINHTHSSTGTTINPTHLDSTTPINLADLSTTSPIDPTQPSNTTPINHTHSSTGTTINPAHLDSTTPINLTDLSTTSPINSTHPKTATSFNPTHSDSTTSFNPSPTTPFIPTNSTTTTTTPIPTTTTSKPDPIQERLQELKTKYPAVEIPTMELSNGLKMPVIALGTANLEPVLTKAIITSAIDMGYRAIDTAYIYGNEQAVGEAVRDKIQDGTVKREDLFIISKLWSTFHREDLVETACNNSLNAMGLDYFDLYLIHNPMSFKEGPNPLPKIATVLQYSTNDYMNAWYGMEPLVSKGLVRGIGVSNFNSTQVARVMEKGRVKPVVNQVECHPYLSQEKLDDFCAQRNIALSCFGVLGSKGTPAAYRGTTATVIDDPLVKVMATALHITPAQLLIAYQLKSERTVVVKSSSAAHLWDNLQALKVNLTDAEMSGLRLMHRNKRIFTFAGMGDTHKNYPFNTIF